MAYRIFLTTGDGKLHSPAEVLDGPTPEVGGIFTIKRAGRREECVATGVSKSVVLEDGLAIDIVTASVTSTETITLRSSQLASNKPG